MKSLKTLLSCLLLFGCGLISAQTGKAKGQSVYTLKPNDTAAVYFTPENFNIKADGKMDLEFLGCDYDIMSGSTSPIWPIAVIDTYFEGQRKAAIQCYETGYALINMHAKNVPVAIEIRENSIDRLYMENCLFDNVTDAGVITSSWGNKFAPPSASIKKLWFPDLNKFRYSIKHNSNDYQV